jgi:hypothetical protein
MCVFSEKQNKENKDATTIIESVQSSFSSWITGVLDNDDDCAESLHCADTCTFLLHNDTTVVPKLFLHPAPLFWFHQSLIPLLKFIFIEINVTLCICIYVIVN